MTPRRRGRRLAAGVMILGACLTSAGCGGRVPGGSRHLSFPPLSAGVRALALLAVQLWVMLVIGGSR